MMSSLWTITLFRQLYPPTLGVGVTPSSCTVKRATPSRRNMNWANCHVRATHRLLKNTNPREMVCKEGHVAVVSMQCTVWGRSVMRSVIRVLLQKEGGVSLQRTEGYSYQCWLLHTPSAEWIASLSSCSSEHHVISLPHHAYPGI